MCKTLIVEDNTTFRQMLKEILYARFPTMEIAEEPDGSELFSKLDAFHPDIVFMDIRLPGENGLELTKKIKMNYPGIIVVILTSYDLPEYRKRLSRVRRIILSRRIPQPKAFSHWLSRSLPAKNMMGMI